MVDYRERLAWAMKQAQVDAAGLAKTLGVTYQAIKKIEAGTSKSLSAKNHELVAIALKVSGYWLATGKGPRVAPQQAGANSGDVLRVMESEKKYSTTPEKPLHWPFDRVTLSQWLLLPEADREKLEAQVMAVVTYTESSKKAA